MRSVKVEHLRPITTPAPAWCGSPIHATVAVVLSAWLRRQRWRFAIGAVLVALTPLAGRAAPAPPALLLLRVGKDAVQREREQRLMDALRMRLDDMPVLAVDPGDEAFCDRPMAAQVAVVRPLLTRAQALAAVWLVSSGPDALLLHVVAVSRGRALVRLVESSGSPGFETNLALAARELLGTAYLFEPKLVPADSPLASVTAELREQAASAAPSIYDFGGGLFAEWPLSAHTGTTWILGASATASRRIAGRLDGRLSLDAGLGPWEGHHARGWLFSPGLGVSYLWRGANYVAGPTACAYLSWYSTTLQVGEGPQTLSTALRPRAYVGVEWRWAVQPWLEIATDAGLVVAAYKDSYARRSTGETVWSNALLGVRGGLGVAVRPP